MLIWCHLPPTTLTAAELKELNPEQLEREHLKGLIEKRTAINLVEAFSVATKHYLRGENGPYYEDLYHLVSGIPKYGFPSSVVGADDRSNVLGLWRTPPDADGKMHIPASRRGRARTTSGAETIQGTHMTDSGSSNLDLEKGTPTTITIELKAAENPPPLDVYHFMPLFIIFRPIIAFVTGKSSARKEVHRRRKEQRALNSHLPLELLLLLNGYVHQLIRRGTLEAPLYGSFLAPVTALQDCVTSLERILTTPLPFAYSGYLSIVGVAVASTMFLGFMELGEQMQQPFGYDDSDLDLGHFCELIRAELHEICAHSSPDFSFVFGDDNQPFGGDDPRSAAQILEDQSSAQAGVHGFRRALASHWTQAVAQAKKEKNKKKTTRAVEVVYV
ncbi:hypothetical protein RQP46_001779 [Phenoliferia psychrophenolica]